MSSVEETIQNLLAAGLSEEEITKSLSQSITLASAISGLKQSGLSEENLAEFLMRGLDIIPERPIYCAGCGNLTGIKGPLPPTVSGYHYGCVPEFSWPWAR